MPLTREEFEQGYAENSCATPEWLHKMNMYAIPCNCDEPDCNGWQMRDLKSLFTSHLDFPTEHIPDDWDGQDLVGALVTDGRTDLVSAVRKFFEARKNALTFEYPLYVWDSRECPDCGQLVNASDETCPYCSGKQERPMEGYADGYKVGLGRPRIE